MKSPLIVGYFLHIYANYINNSSQLYLLIICFNAALNIDVMNYIRSFIFYENIYNDIGMYIAYLYLKLLFLALGM